MSIHKRVNKHGTAAYEVRYRHDGHNFSRSFSNKQDAESYEARVVIHRSQGNLSSLTAGRTRLDDFAAVWWATEVKGSREDATVEGYRYCWNNHVLPYLGTLQLREINPRTVDSWRWALQDKGVGSPTIRKSMTVLQRCMKRAVLYGEIEYNPCREVDKPSAKRTSPVEPLTPSQIEAIRGHMLERRNIAAATLVSVMGYAGLRPGEALALEWKHIRKRTILVEQALSRGKIKSTKTNKHRSVILRESLRADLLELRIRQGNPDGGWVFPNKFDTFWSEEGRKSWGRKAFRKAAVSAGVPEARTYDLRHTYASLLFQEGRTAVEVAAQLGHAPSMSLDTYAHVIADLDGDHRPMDELIAEARLARMLPQEEPEPTYLDTVEQENRSSMNGGPSNIDVRSMFENRPAPSGKVKGLD